MQRRHGRHDAGSRTAPGFGLLEVIVALAVLAVATLGIVEVLLSGLGHAGRSDRLSRALEIASQTALELTSATPVPEGWQDRAVLPEGAAVRFPCRRRLESVAAGERTWFEVLVECGAGPDAVGVRLRLLR